MLFDDFASSVKFENGRYKVALPWREFHDPLPNNHQLSANRLQGLLQRLKQEPVILEEYNRIIQEQLNEGSHRGCSTRRDSTGHCPLCTCHTMSSFIGTRQPQRCE